MPGSKLYRFDPQAWLELEAADDWYRQRNPEASVRFLAAVYDALETIAQWPQRWPKVCTRNPAVHTVALPVFHRLSGRTYRSEYHSHRPQQAETGVLERSAVTR